jgi:hypothetical protein
MSKLTLDFHGNGTDNTTTYDDAALGSSVSLFPLAKLTVDSPAASDRPTQIVLNITNPASTMQFGVKPVAQTLFNAFFTLAFDPSTGDLTLGWNGTPFTAGKTDAPPANTWQSIIDSLTYANSVAEDPASHAITLVSATSVAGGYTTVNAVDAETLLVTCFYKGTMIRAPHGEVAVESLAPGDLVLTADGDVAAVRWIGRQTVSTVFGDKLRVLPIRIKAGALGDAVPSRDLLISPDHALLVDGILIHAGALVNGTSIAREVSVPQSFPYFHVELDAHALLLAESAPAESFVDNADRLGFDNWAEHEAIYPEGKPIREMPYPRAKARRQVPKAILDLIDRRAQADGAGKTAAA